MAEVVLKNVTKKFGKVVAVNNFTLDIKDGEFIVLLGPSGCGKTTTLRLVAGLEEATSGEIYIGDRLVNDVPPKDRDVAMVFQNYALYPHMTVYENMAFGLKLRKYPKDEIERRVREAARMLEIEHLLDRKPKQLSGGQRQRVALGRAIVRQPKVFLMDEPLSNLDAKLRVQMRAEISKLQKRLGVTTIYVTHDQVEAMTMGDRIVVMNEGKIQQVGGPLEVYEKPANVFVAGFIGSPPMNFFTDVTLYKNAEGQFALKVGPYDLPLPEKIAKEFGNKLETFVDRKVIFGLRPENILDREFVADEAVENEAWVLKAMVDLIEPMGAETFVYSAFDGYRFVARVNPHTHAQRGKEHIFYFDMNKMHLFDPETELAII